MTYREWTIEPFDGVQIGHKLPDSRNLRQEIGHGTHRKVKGYLVTHPTEMPNGKAVDTIRAGQAYIDNYLS